MIATIVVASVNIANNLTRLTADCARLLACLLSTIHFTPHILGRPIDRHSAQITAADIGLSFFAYWCSCRQHIATMFAGHLGFFLFCSNTLSLYVGVVTLSPLLLPPILAISSLFWKILQFIIFEFAAHLLSVGQRSLFTKKLKFE